MRQILPLFVGVLLLFTYEEAWGDEVLTTDNIERGSIESIREQGKGEFELKIGGAVLNVKDVVSARFARRKMTKSGKFLVALVGGSRLYGETVKYDSGKGMFYLDVCDLGKLEVNANMVRGVFVLENIKESGFIEDALKDEATSDFVLLTTGGKVEGTLVSLSDEVVGFSSPALGGDVTVKIK
ncbi:MAG: hypothetical protein N2234_10535, partial [Planctomycetota bacterium]|nr:hypothetical protein [Planctomycetota bacterium]